MNTKNPANIILALLTLNLSLSGCSAFRTSQQVLNIGCSEPDAAIMVNRIRYTPPVQVSVKRNRDVSIQAYKEGFIPFQQTISHHLNGTGALDAVGTLFFIIPCIGLFCPGAWSLDETDIYITLYKK